MSCRNQSNNCGKINAIPTNCKSLHKKVRLRQHLRLQLPEAIAEPLDARFFFQKIFAFAQKLHWADVFGGEFLLPVGEELVVEFQELEGSGQFTAKAEVALQVGEEGLFVAAGGDLGLFENGQALGSAGLFVLFGLVDDGGGVGEAGAGGAAGGVGQAEGGEVLEPVAAAGFLEFEEGGMGGVGVEGVDGGVEGGQGREGIAAPWLRSPTAKAMGRFPRAKSMGFFPTTKVMG